MEPITDVDILEALGTNSVNCLDCGMSLNKIRIATQAQLKSCEKECREYKKAQDQILKDTVKEAKRLVAQELVDEIEGEMELEKCDPDVMAYFTPYYAIPEDKWQALISKYLKKYGGEG